MWQRAPRPCLCGWRVTNEATRSQKPYANKARRQTGLVSQPTRHRRGKVVRVRAGTRSFAVLHGSKPTLRRASSSRTVRRAAPGDGSGRREKSGRPNGFASAETAALLQDRRHAPGLPAAVLEVLPAAVLVRRQSNRIV